MRAIHFSIFANKIDKRSNVTDGIDKSGFWRYKKALTKSEFILIQKCKHLSFWLKGLRGEEDFNLIICIKFMFDFKLHW